MSAVASKPWSIDVVTLFPEWFAWLEQCRPIANAQASGQIALRWLDPRPYTPLGHGQVDDAPYGGGAGMVLRVDVLVAALEAIYDAPLETVREQRRIVALTPAGEQFGEPVALTWSGERRPTTILCGRYEGFDWRIHEHVATEELSIGPYVLSGGEVAAMAIIDAVARKLPGALGNVESLAEESFATGLGGGGEYPHYTRPAAFRGWGVPDVLLSGDHGKIAQWRQAMVRRGTHPQNEC